MTGRPGVAQGRYGVAGNLELVACATDDGMWVGWFNCDPVEHRLGAAVGHWSGALRFGSGSRYVAASVTQVRPGPDWLEVLALNDAGDLHRHVWSPADAFIDHGVIADRVTASSRLVEAADGTFAIVATGERGVRSLVGRIGPNYPDVEFHDAKPEPMVSGSDGQGAVDVDAEWHEDHLDVVHTRAGGQVWLACAASSDGGRFLSGGAASARIAVSGRARAVAIVSGRGRGRLIEVGAHGPERSADLGPATQAGIASVTRAGRAEWHVVTSSSGSMRHVIGEVGAEGPLDVETAAVEAVAWAAPGGSSLHRDR